MSAWASDCSFSGIELVQISQEVTERFYNLLATRWARLASLNTVVPTHHHNFHFRRHRSMLDQREATGEVVAGTTIEPHL